MLARSFAARFFGVPPGAVATIGEDYQEEVWEEWRFSPPHPGGDPAKILEECVRAVEDETGGDAVRKVYRALAGRDLGEGPWPEARHAALSHNELVFRLHCGAAGLPAARGLGPPVGAGS